MRGFWVSDHQVGVLIDNAANAQQWSEAGEKCRALTNPFQVASAGKPGEETMGVRNWEPEMNQARLQDLLDTVGNPCSFTVKLYDANPPAGSGLTSLEPK